MANICLIEKKWKNIKHKVIFEEIMVIDFLKLMKDMSSHI